MHRGAGAIYPGGARAHQLLRVEGARRGTGLEQLQMPTGKLLALLVLLTVIYMGVDHGVTIKPSPRIWSGGR